MTMEAVQLMQLQPKTTPITDDYELSNEELGAGVNGKVLACQNKAGDRKCALKVTSFSCCYRLHVKQIRAVNPQLLRFT